MNDFWMTLRNMSWNLTHRLGWADVVDILIVAAILYEVMILMRRTRSSALLKGIVLLLLMVAASSLLGLTSLNWLMNSILQNGGTDRTAGPGGTVSAGDPQNPGKDGAEQPAEQRAPDGRCAG